MRIFGFAGFSGSGKTTLIERLIPLLAERGLRVSLIKHAHHGFDVDQHDRRFDELHQRRGARLRCGSLADPDGIFLAQAGLLSEKRVRREAVAAAVGFAYDELDRLELRAAQLALSESGTELQKPLQGRGAVADWRRRVDANDLPWS